MTRRTAVLVRAACWLVLLAAAFFWLDRGAFHCFRTITLYDHWGEMREGLTAAKFLASGLGILVVGLVVGFLDPRRWRRAAAFWLVVALAAAAGTVVKVAAGRERPSGPHQVRGHERTIFAGPSLGLRRAAWQSFPSGHTLSAFAAATTLAAFYPGAAPVFYAVATATGVNRIVAHQHFFSDVVAGAGLGHFLALFFLDRRWIRRLWRPVPGSGATVGSGS